MPIILSKTVISHALAALEWIKKTDSLLTAIKKERNKKMHHSLESLIKKRPMTPERVE